MTKRWNFGIEYMLMATAPGSVATGLFFWKTDAGKLIWAVLSGITALVSLAKPLLKLSKRIENLQNLITYYRSAESQLEELANDIRRDDKYTEASVRSFKAAEKQFRKAEEMQPHERIDEKLRQKYFLLVKQELPESGFHFPAP
jgi:biopolymer transport protein ExbB/TolQ